MHFTILYSDGWQNRTINDPLFYTRTGSSMRVLSISLVIFQGKRQPERPRRRQKIREFFNYS